MAATAGFAADVAHELKNPLSSLRSAAETISRISDPEQQQRLMNVILRDVARLDRLITDISRASRLDNEMASESARVIDLRDLVTNFVEARQTTTETHKLVANVSEVPVMVSVHDGRIVQILDNLLGNAVSFAPVDSQISFSVDPGEDGMARLQVRDQGPGIPPGRLQEIFNRFYSERPASEAFGEHSGLGLSIAQQIAHGYGGDLVAANDEGACFSLSLPLAKA
jgi:two-component system sensor histidine kinase ChvG